MNVAELSGLPGMPGGLIHLLGAMVDRILALEARVGSLNKHKHKRKRKKRAAA